MDSLGFNRNSSIDYESVIKINGRPILAPVMTSSKCEEMRMYRRQAIQAETRIQAKSRQRLLKKVQHVINRIENQHNKTETDDSSKNGECNVNHTTLPHSMLYSHTVDINHDKSIPKTSSSQSPNNTRLCASKKESGLNDSAFLDSYKSSIYSHFTSDQNVTSSTFNRVPLSENNKHSPDSGLSSSVFVPNSDKTDLIFDTRLSSISKKDTGLLEDQNSSISLYEMEDTKHLETLDSISELSSDVQSLISSQNQKTLENDQPGTSSFIENHFLACPTVHNSSSSSEMDKTVIDCDKFSPEITLKDNENSSNIEAAITDSSELTLLNQVDFDSINTPEKASSIDNSSKLGFNENQTSYFENVLPCDENFSQRISLISTKTKNLTDASNFVNFDLSSDCLLSENHNSPESTYLNGSVTPQSDLAKPFTKTDVCESLPLSSLDSSSLPMSLAANQKFTEIVTNSGVKSSNSSPINCIVTSSCGQTHDSSIEKPASITKRHVRQGSYTLDAPSPALLKAQADAESIDKKNSFLNTSGRCTPELSKSNSDKCSSENSMFTFTSSMRDLNLKPVQRRLDYAEVAQKSCTNDPRPASDVNSEVEGRLDHLNKYLNDVNKFNPSMNIMAFNKNLSSTDSVMAPNQPITSLPVSARTLFSLPFETSNLPSTCVAQPIINNYISVSSVASNADNSTHVSPNQPIEQNSVKESDLLEMQAKYFDELRQQLILTQRQQLNTLLLQQEQQQLQLQKELLQASGEITCNTTKSQLDHINLASSFSQSNPVLHTANNVSHSVNSPYSSTVNSIVKQFKETKCSIPLLTDLQNHKLNSSSFAEKSSPKTNQVVFEPSKIVKTKVSAPNTSALKRSLTKNNFYTLGLSNKEIIATASLNNIAIDETYSRGFQLISAHVKGYLTRRLLNSDKVQNIIQTIKDTAQFALNFQAEIANKNGVYTQQDVKLQERVIAQLTSAMYEIHDVFFEISIADRMNYISNTRQLEKEKIFKGQKLQKQHRLSEASLKAINRRNKTRETVNQRKSILIKPVAAASSTSGKRKSGHVLSRVLKPIQTVNSPVKSVDYSPDENSLEKAKQNRIKFLNTHKKIVSSNGRTKKTVKHQS